MRRWLQCLPLIRSILWILLLPNFPCYPSNRERPRVPSARSRPSCPFSPCVPDRRSHRWDPPLRTTPPAPPPAPAARSPRPGGLPRPPPATRARQRCPPRPASAPAATTSRVWRIFWTGGGSALVLADGPSPPPRSPRRAKGQAAVLCFSDRNACLFPSRSLFLFLWRFSARPSRADRSQNLKTRRSKKIFRRLALFFRSKGVRPVCEGRGATDG